MYYKGSTLKKTMGKTHTPIFKHFETSKTHTQCNQFRQKSKTSSELVKRTDTNI